MKSTRAPNGTWRPWKRPLIAPFVVGGVTVDHRDVAGEAIVLDRWGPECRGVKSRLDNSATAAFPCPSDTVLGNTVSLRHPRSRGGKSPTAGSSGGNQFRRVIAVETCDVVPGASEVLERLNGMVGRLSRFRVGG